jgi:hypothetical protein
MKKRDHGKTAAPVPYELDSRLRRGLEPDRETVERVVRGALSARPVAARGPGGLRALATAAVLLFLALVVLGLVQIGDDPSGERGVALERGARPVPIIGNASGRVAILVDGRSIWPDAGRRADQALEPKRPVILNSNCLVGVALPHGTPQFLILGGES